MLIFSNLNKNWNFINYKISKPEPVFEKSPSMNMFLCKKFRFSIKLKINQEAAELLSYVADKKDIYYSIIRPIYITRIKLKPKSTYEFKDLYLVKVENKKKYHHLFFDCYKLIIKN